MKIVEHLYSKSKNYFISHQTHLLFLFLMLSVLFFLSRFPYINIFLSITGIVVVFWIIVLIVLRLNKRATFIFALIILLASPLFIIFKNKSLAELSGNTSYFLLLIGFVQNFWEYIKSLKEKNNQSV